MSAPSRGRRLGVDVGKVRVGVAMSDPDGILATPLVTVPRDTGAAADAVPSDIAELVRLVGEYEAVQVVVGLPVQLNGAEGPAAIDIRAYARAPGGGGRRGADRSGGREDVDRGRNP